MLVPLRGTYAMARYSAAATGLAQPRKMYRTVSSSTVPICMPGPPPPHTRTHRHTRRHNEETVPVCVSLSLCVCAYHDGQVGHFAAQHHVHRLVRQVVAVHYGPNTAPASVLHSHSLCHSRTHILVDINSLTHMHIPTHIHTNTHAQTDRQTDRQTHRHIRVPACLWAGSA
jgi:hypothetical protein